MLPLPRFVAAMLVSVTCIMCMSCAPSSYDSPTNLGVLPAQPPVPLWLGAMHGTGNAAVTGASAVTPSQTPGWAHVLISVNGAASGGIYTWSLRSGSCGAQGGVIGPTERYGDFPIRADGSGAAEAEIPATLSPSTPYAVTATPASTGSTTAATGACADLTRGSM